MIFVSIAKGLLLSWYLNSPGQFVSQRISIVLKAFVFIKFSLNAFPLIIKAPFAVRRPLSSRTLSTTTKILSQSCFLGLVDLGICG